MTTKEKRTLNKAATAELRILMAQAAAVVSIIEANTDRRNTRKREAAERISEGIQRARLDLIHLL